jgi:acetyltransferase-like isoleucine patch superfamily enzyme
VAYNELAGTGEKTVTIYKPVIPYLKNIRVDTDVVLENNTVSYTNPSAIKNHVFAERNILANYNIFGAEVWFGQYPILKHMQERG